MDLKNGYIFFHNASGISDGEADFDITGPDIYKVRLIAEKFSKEISGIKGASEIIYRYREGRPEIHAVIDKQKSAASGLTSGEVGEFIKSSLYGPVVSKFIDKGEVDITCRLDLGGKSAVDAVHDLKIPNDQGREIPLREISVISESSGITSIWHKNKEIKESITVRIQGADQLEFLKKAEEAANSMHLPAGYYIEAGANSVKLKKSVSEMILAVIMALLLVYMAVAAVYESLIIPLVSLISIPFSMIGISAALLAGRYSVDVTVYMGAVVLIGITVNNSIILIDSMMELKSSSLSGIIKSASGRIRPIMMTTLTTVCGLIPMLFGNGMWNGFAVTVISGLLVSTLLVLIIVPLVYSDLKRFR
jgi:HAE1 family hydrophobic/amphiphilic exporter-1